MAINIDINSKEKKNTTNEKFIHDDVERLDIINNKSSKVISQDIQNKKFDLTSQNKNIVDKSVSFVSNNKSSESTEHNNQVTTNKKNESKILITLLSIIILLSLVGILYFLFFHKSNLNLVNKQSVTSSTRNITSTVTTNNIVASTSSQNMTISSSKISNSSSNTVGITQSTSAIVSTKTANINTNTTIKLNNSNIYIGTFGEQNVRSSRIYKTSEKLVYIYQLSELAKDNDIFRYVLTNISNSSENTVQDFDFRDNRNNDKNTIAIPSKDIGKFRISLYIGDKLLDKLEFEITQ